MSEESKELGVPSSVHPLVLQLRQNLSSCCQSIEGGEEGLPKLESFLASVSGAAVFEPENRDAETIAVEFLAEIQRFLFSSSLDQAIVDALSFELPKAISKFAGFSDKCGEIADSIVDWFVGKCNPRDMLSVLCEALDSLSSSDDPGYAAPLLTGLSKVFISIKRRHFEQAKVAVPIILKVLKVLSLGFAGRDEEIDRLFKRALLIVDSINAVSRKLECGVCEKLQSLMGLFVLQMMALTFAIIPSEPSACVAPVSDTSKLLPQCGLTYLGLLTGSDIDVKINLVTKEEDDLMDSFPDIKQGAALSVIWGHISDKIAREAGQDMSAMKDVLRHNQVKRWEAMSMLKYILSSVSLPMEIKRHTIDFMLCITDASSTLNCHNAVRDCITYMPGLCATSKAITMVIMHAPDSALRKNAFEALKRVLADTPTSERIDILQALITNSDSSSMTAILLDLVRGELNREIFPGRSANRAESENLGNPIASVWTERILELVGIVVRPQEGGLPSFPEHGDSVLSALNLYRFVVMRESAGKTNRIGALSRRNLVKAYNEWFLPLRTLVSGIMAGQGDDADELGSSLNPIELVLYHCIELAEEHLSANLYST